jgi:hypothetical protein
MGKGVSVVMGQVNLTVGDLPHQNYVFISLRRPTTFLDTRRGNGERSLPGRSLDGKQRYFVLSEHPCCRSNGYSNFSLFSHLDPVRRSADGVGGPFRFSWLMAGTPRPECRAGWAPGSTLRAGSSFRGDKRSRGSAEAWARWDRLLPGWPTAVDRASGVGCPGLR